MHPCAFGNRVLFSVGWECELGQDGDDAWESLKSNAGRVAEDCGVKSTDIVLGACVRDLLKYLPATYTYTS